MHQIKNTKKNECKNTMQKNANKMQSQKCSSHFSCILILNLGFCICFSKIMFVWSDLHFFGFAIFLLSYIFSELMFVQLVPGLICIFLHASLFFFVFLQNCMFQVFFFGHALVICASPRLSFFAFLFALFLHFFQDVDILEQAQFDSTNMWGCIKTPYLFKLPKIALSFFFPLIVFSGGELPVDKKCEFTRLP